MSRNYMIRDQEKLYLISFATVNWIDIFIRREYKDVIVDSLNFCVESKDLQIYAWCIMSSHVQFNYRNERRQQDGRYHPRYEKALFQNNLKVISDNPKESKRVDVVDV